MTRFCEECGALLLKPDEKGNYRCVSGNPNCKSKNKENVDLQEDKKLTFSTIEHEENENDILIAGEDEGEQLPTIAIVCENCNHNEAYYWTQLIENDEDASECQIFKCCNCKHQWRDYGK